MILIFSRSASCHIADMLVCQNRFWISTLVANVISHVIPEVSIAAGFPSTNTLEDLEQNQDKSPTFAGLLGNPII